jgi:uncharacterized protein (DUF4415 family)
MSKSKKQNKEITLLVTEKDYQVEIASGVEQEFALNPGEHKFVRGGHRQINPSDLETKNTKVRITINIDLDILNEFKQRASIANAAPYQTQINNALRHFLTESNSLSNAVTLLENETFISALAKRVSEQIQQTSK